MTSSASEEDIYGPYILSETASYVSKHYVLKHNLIRSHC